MWGAALVLGLMVPGGSLLAGPPPGPPSGTASVAPPAVSSQVAPRLWVLRAEPQSPAAPYVGVIGDSTGSQLADALADALRHRDVGVVVATVGRQRALFSTWAGRHADRVTVVDLAPVVCPAGPPCGQVVGGVRLRSDNVHYTHEGARLAGEKIMNNVEALRTLRGPAA